MSRINSSNRNTYFDGIYREIFLSMATIAILISMAAAMKFF